MELNLLKTSSRITLLKRFKQGRSLLRDNPQFWLYRDFYKHGIISVLTEVLIINFELPKLFAK